jgi:F-box protein 18 (helicase)
MITLTDEQEAVISKEVKPGEALKVIALAGTGKTSTLVEYANAHDHPMLYLAFNKSVEIEAKEKFGPNVRPKTWHALAYATHGRPYRNLGNLRYYAVMKFLKADVYAATLVCKTLENYLNSADEAISLKHVAPDLLCKFKAGYESQLIDGARAVWEQVKRGNDPFPMTHSGYLKLYQLSKPVIPARTILLDEAQDQAPVMVDIVRQQMANGTRVILVGDKFQQIYSWRGAVDAMDMIDAPTLYLTQSFRFGDKIAGAANKLLIDCLNCEKPVVGHPDITDELPDTLPSDEPYTIICRTNVEIFRQALRCAVAQTPMCMVGGDGFNAFLEAIMDVFYLYAGLYDQIKERQISFFKSFNELKAFAEARLDPELQARVNIINEYKDAVPNHVENIRKNITAARLAKVFIVTAHKAKGLEWNNVMLTNDFASLYDEEDNLLPVSTGDPEEDARRGYKKTIPRDEVNLLYVAATRAKRRLKPNHDLRVLLNYY